VTSKSPQIEVTEIGGTAVVRLRRTEFLMSSVSPRQDVGEDLFSLVYTDHHSLIVLDFENPDIHWLSGAFQALLVTLHHRLFKANGVLKLCNVPASIMEQFQVNQLVKYFNIYPDLEAALKRNA
jgi:anti-anti-sigma regulatory factor